MSKQTVLSCALLLSVIGFSLVGCASKKADVSEVKTAPLSTAEQISQIQNNPHMPPAAKERAIQALQTQQANAALMRQAQNKTK